MSLHEASTEITHYATATGLSPEAEVYTAQAVEVYAGMLGMRFEPELIDATSRKLITAQDENSKGYGLEYPEARIAGLALIIAAHSLSNDEDREIVGGYLEELLRLYPEDDTAQDQADEPMSQQEVTTGTATPDEIAMLEEGPGVAHYAGPILVGGVLVDPASRAIANEQSPLETIPDEFGKRSASGIGGRRERLDDNAVSSDYEEFWNRGAFQSPNVTSRRHFADRITRFLGRTA